MTYVESKALGVRLSAITRDRFAAQAEAEGLNQSEMLEKIMANYLDRNPGSDPATSTIPPPQTSLEGSDFTDSIEAIKLAARDLENPAQKIRESEGAEGYKRSLLQIVDETSAINNMLGGMRKLQEVIGASHRLILEAAEGASEPFAKIVADQAAEALKFDAIYNRMASNIQALERVSSESVSRAEKVAETLDRKVTDAVVDSARNIHKRTEKYLDMRRGYLNWVIGISIASALAAGSSLYYSGFIVKENADKCRRVADFCSDLYDNFTDASCQYRSQGKLTKIEALMATARCK